MEIVNFLVGKGNIVALVFFVYLNIKYFLFVPSSQKYCFINLVVRAVPF